MESEHYCQTHSCKFYRNEKGDKVWYSHKIKGSDPAQYCNELKEEAIAKKQSPSTPAPKSTTRFDAVDASIEAQVSFKGFITLLEAKIITPDSPVGKATLKWGMSNISPKSRLVEDVEEIFEDV